MFAFASPVSGSILLALLVAVAALTALLRYKVKLRHVSHRWLGFRVDDFSADVKLPSPSRSRSYQIALYVTMKAMPRDAALSNTSSAKAPAQ